MSWTKRQLIEAAFAEIGLAAYTYDLQPGELERALRTMDSMLASWNAEGVRISYPLPSSPENSDLDAETTIPDSANKAIRTGLAIELAPSYGKTVSPDTSKGFKRSFRNLLTKSTMPIEKQLPQTMPSGAGNKFWRDDDYSEFVDPPVDQIEVGPDDILEYE